MPESRRLSPWIAVAALMALYVAGYAWSAPHTDSADELMRAYEVRHGLAFPLQGPPLGQVLHLGPAWFYLCAVGLWLGGSWLGTALFVGAVCSLKFPLAYWCGRELLDRRFGLLWAVALLVPGWSTLEQIVFLNPNAVAAAILGVLAISIRAARAPSLATFAALGLMLALAAHVHPNAAPAAMFALPAVVRFRRAGGSLLAAAMAFAAAFCIPFAPYVALQVSQGFPDFGAASTYVKGEINAAGVLQAPAIVWHYLATGPALVAEWLGRWSPEAARTTGLLLAILELVAALAALASPSRAARRLAWLFLAAVIVFAAWIGAMRTTTPFQFTWALEPAMAGVLALGLHAAWHWRASRAVAIAIVAAIVVGDAAAFRAMALRVEDGEGRFPSLVLDIQGRLPPAVYVGGWFPAWAHGPLGRLLCDAPDPLALHGHLGYLEDKDLGLDTLLACGKRDGLALRGGGRDLLGMSQPFWRALGANPECTIGGLGLTASVSVPVAQDRLEIARGDTYLPRHYSGNLPRERTYSFNAPGQHGVLVTNLLGGYEHFTLLSASVDGREVAPAARNDFAILYAAPGRDGPVSWTVRLEVSNPEGIDLVTVDRSQQRAGGCNLFAAR